MLAGFIFSAASEAHRDLSDSNNKLSGFTSCKVVQVWEIQEVSGSWFKTGNVDDVWGNGATTDLNLETWILSENQFATSQNCCQISLLTLPVYTSEFDCASFSPLQCIVCVNTTVNTVNQHLLPFSHPVVMHSVDIPLFHMQSHERALV